MYSKRGKDIFEGRPPQISSDNRLSIHSNQCIKFMEEMGASLQVLSILKSGYKLPMPVSPPPYFEQNNKSAEKHMEFLRNVYSSLPTQTFTKTKLYIADVLRNYFDKDPQAIP